MSGTMASLQGMALASATNGQAVPASARGAMALFTALGLILGLMIVMLVLITMARAIRRRRKPALANGSGGGRESSDAWAEAGRRLSESGNSRE